jgi:hypothetical protein
MPVDTSQYPQVIIQGQYPQSRFFSFTTYVAKGAPAGYTLDVDINPDPGSSNPFQQTPQLPQHNYTVNVGGMAGQSNQVNFGNTTLAWIIYRIYVPNQGLNMLAGVPLPAVTLVDANGGTHSIAPCNSPRNQQVNLLIGDLRADGLNLLADYWKYKFTYGDDLGYAPDSSCQPEDNVVFWIAANTGGYFPNPYNMYIAAGGLCFHLGKYLVVRGKVADFPDTYNGNPVWQPAFPGNIQLRYWSLCNNDQVPPFPVVFCQPDHAANLDSQGYYTYVVGGDFRPLWLPPSATWLPWGSKLVNNILIFRNMYPATDPPFDESVQAAHGCAVDNKLNQAPPRYLVVKGGICAHRVMKEYYPQAVYCDEAVLRSGGWQACFAQNSSEERP